MKMQELSSLAKIWSAAYQEALIKDRNSYGPTDTVQPYDISDMRKNVYEYVSADSYPELDSTPDSFWHSIVLLRECIAAVQLEVKWSAALPASIDHWNELFRANLSPIDRSALMSFATVAVPQTRVVNQFERTVISTQPWKNVGIRNWWKKQKGKRYFAIWDQPSTENDADILQLLFYRYAALQTMGTVQDQKTALKPDAILAPFIQSAETISDFAQVWNSEPLPIGFKLHVRGKFSPEDLNVFRVLERVASFCGKHNLSWKVRMPIHPAENSFSETNSRYDGTWITLYANRKTANAAAVLNAAEVQRMWRESLSLGKELDEQLAQLKSPRGVSRSPTDWLITSQSKSSRRVQVRFGENDKDPDKQARFLGGAKSLWNDSRERPFEDNVAFVSPSELKSIAQQAGVAIEPYSPGDF